MDSSHCNIADRTTHERAGLDKIVTLLEAARLSDRLTDAPGGLQMDERRFNFMLPATQNVISLIIE
jgi:hypothetical protein